MESVESALIEYFSECEEILQRFSITLSSVEKGQSGLDAIGCLYRDMHTLKGSSQLFGFQKTAELAHAIETSLEPIRRFQLKIPNKIIDSLFKTITLMEGIIKGSIGAQQEVLGTFEDQAKEVIPELLATTTHFFGGEIVVPTEPGINLRETVLTMEDKKGTIEKSSIGSQSGMELKADSEAIEHVELTREVREAIEGAEANSTIRIQVILLDRLMNLVGEMVLVRNQMLQYGQKHDALEFLNLSQRLDAVTSELQGEVMKTRMQPIASILSKFQRVIRDLAKELNKQIELTVQGAETELDKTLLEAIKDPLTHIIRNSCDHGLESSDERIKAGKPPQGHIQISAFHEGGHVIIEVVDDGRGLNPTKVLEKALEKKIITQEQAKKMSKREVMHLIFAPGFSTAERVTAVSGRGVGMDVVKTNLERIGGQVELQSEVGQGMTVRLRIPLTLAIVPALIVRTAGEQFAIPQVKLSELVRVGMDGNGGKVESLQGRPVFRLRGQLLSLVALKDVLGVETGDQDFTKSDSLTIVVLKGEGENFGLIVDEVKDTADIVVKPLPHFLKKIQLYSGATIMGDGGVSLILDVAGVADKGRVHQKAAKGSFVSDSILSQKGKKNDLEYQDFLFFKLNSVEKYCLPLCLVKRLEEFSFSEIQRSGKQRIVKYRNSILPVISLNEFFGLNKGELLPEVSKNGADENQTKKSNVIVVQRNSKQYGIEVNELVDIISVKNNIEEPIREIKGILGGIIVEDEVATVIDVFGILTSVVGVSEPEQTGDSLKKNRGWASQGGKPINVLFAEDTVFFMKQVRKVLEKAGYHVKQAQDGEEAWRLLSASKPGEINLVLTDIEMPQLDGFGLAGRIRKDERYGKIPMIALTTKYRDVDRDRGKKVGFDRYLEKLRSDELLTAIHEVLEEYGNVK